MVDLFDYGFVSEADFDDADFFAVANAENAYRDSIPARVTAVHKERYELICKFGQTFGRLKTKVYYDDGNESFPTTGDFVMIKYIEFSDCQIVKTLGRKTFFSRRDPTPGRGEQAIAANFDYVFILASLNHEFNVSRILRYLTMTWKSGAIPVVLLTKSDLVEDFSQQVDDVKMAARGVDVHAVSAKTGFGIDELSGYLKPRKTLVFLGSSGVGKSSLVNALDGENVMAVKEIREDDSKGRHTTTHRQLVMLPSGVMIIDTPGMRELGMWDADSGIGEAFYDIEERLGKCRYSDCKHQCEPGCVILEAIANGDLTKDRWKNYLLIRNESRRSGMKAAMINKKAAKIKYQRARDERVDDDY
ncbi:MAG: ribosome small subunit-dependent GTPase A [Saccharofermentanales bacterium]